MTIVLAVIDSFGIGAAPDAKSYGDEGSHTAYHIGTALGKVAWPNLQSLGLGNAALLTCPGIPGCESLESPLGSYGVLIPRSPGKDTTTGHWELAGLVLEKAFPILPGAFPSFPKNLTDELTRRTGFTFLGNKAASGTEIIMELGDEHVKTRRPIIYTSGDSVLQIAAHESIITLKELYQLCETARELSNPYYIGRVIARPFIGESGHYSRSSGRHDYSFPIPGPTVLDHLQSKGIQTIGVGKIGDIFLGHGLSASYPDKGNPDCLRRTLELTSEKSDHDRLIFVNLVDTDMVYGHRRDPLGYHNCVQETDAALKQIIQALRPEDHLMITADHGCDPTFRGTDHTREMVPFLHYHKKSPGKNLGLLDGFGQAASELCTAFHVDPF